MGQGVMIRKHKNAALGLQGQSGNGAVDREDRKPTENIIQRLQFEPAKEIGDHGDAGILHVRKDVRDPTGEACGDDAFTLPLKESFFGVADNEKLYSSLREHRIGDVKKGFKAVLLCRPMKAADDQRTT